MFGTILAATVAKSIAFYTVALLAFISAYTRNLAVSPILSTTSFSWEVAGYSHLKPEKHFCVSENKKRKLQINLFSNLLDGSSLQMIDFGLFAWNFIISRSFYNESGHR